MEGGAHPSTPPKQARTRTVRGALLVSVAFVVLTLGALVPPLFIPEAQDGWTESEAVAGYYARERIRSAGGPLQRLLNLKVSARDVQPDPSGCDWGYGTAVLGIVTVQTYTLFGIPAETWVVDCRSERLT